VRLAHISSSVAGRSTRSLGCMAAEFIEPTAASRRKLAMLFVVALIAGVGIIELLKAQTAELNTRSICESITTVWLWFVVAFGGLIMCGIWAAWMAHQALKLNQLPLPGTWVFRRTPILRDGAVKWRAYAMLGWSIFVIAGSGVSSYFVWDYLHRAYSRCELQSTMRPNNTLERTVKHRGPRLAAVRSSWPAAQLGR
jgi:hypothetical protein